MKMPGDEAEIVSFETERLEKNIKILQKQIFGVVERNVKKVVRDSETLSSDPEKTEALRRTIRLRKICDDLEKKIDNRFTAVLLFQEDMKSLYIASCQKYSPGYDCYVFELKEEPEKKCPIIRNSEQIVEDVSNSNMNEWPKQFLNDWGITSIWGYPITNVSGDHIGTLVLSSQGEVGSPSERDIKNIQDALDQLKITLTTDDVDLKKENDTHTA